MTRERLLSVEGIVKSFPGVRALKGVDFDVFRGEVHALVGENGAGKSTLVNIVAGALRPDAGSIEFDGDEVVELDPHSARRLGIGLMRQEPTLVPQLTVLENVTLGVEQHQWGFEQRAEMRGRVVRHLQRLGIDIHPDTRVEGLRPAQQQLVALCKTTFHEPRLIIMDEPTASFSVAEKDLLFSIIREQVGRGASIIYISHRLEEIFEIAERVTVLRDGELVGTLSAVSRSISADDLIPLMVGRELAGTFPERSRSTAFEEGKTLVLKGLLGDLDVDRPDLVLRSGQILGITGLVGSGRSRLVHAIFTGDGDRSSVEIDGRAPRRGAVGSVGAGIGLVPEDRRGQGLVDVMSVQENISLASPGEISRSGWLRRAADREIAQRYIRSLSIKAFGPDQDVEKLSGGNQQKVVIAKWMCRDSDILIFDEPTNGIDVGAKQEIYQRILDLADQGRIVLVVSSEMHEVLGLSDVILVMHRGRPYRVFNRDEATPERILTAALGREEAV